MSRSFAGSTAGSSCCAVYFLKKSEVLKIQEVLNLVLQSMSGEKIGALRTGNGGRVLSKEFPAHFTAKEIHHELTIPHNPEHNGVAKKNEHSSPKSANTSHANLPNGYWVEAVST